MSSDVSISCSTKCRIRLLKGGWRIADDNDDMKYVKLLTVELSIVGSEKDGFHLVAEPEGCFSSDDYYATMEEARIGATNLYRVPQEAWKSSNTK